MRFLTKMLSNPTAWIALAVVALIIWIATRGLRQTSVDISKGAVDVVGGTFQGVVTGVSGNIGIPDTDKVRCQAALKKNDYWGASLYCPAKDFLTGIFRPSVSKTDGDVPGVFTVNPSIFTGR